MADAVTIATSGLRAQKQKVGVAAHNIANVSTAGAVPTAQGVSTVYRPLQAQFHSLPNGGVGVNITEKNDAYHLSYNPSAAYADAQGLIAVPNVDLAQEIVDAMMAKNAFKANALTIKVGDEMERKLLDTLL